MVLANAVPVPWEAVYIFGPYTSSEAIDRILGFQWDSPAKTWLEGTKGYDLLVFVSGKRVVRYAVVSYPYGFCMSAQGRRIARDAAMFNNGCL